MTSIELDQEKLINNSTHRVRKSSKSLRSTSKKLRIPKSGSLTVQGSHPKIRQLRSAKRVRDWYKSVRMGIKFFIEF